MQRGNWNNAANAGLRYVNVNNAASNTNSNIASAISYNRNTITEIQNARTSVSLPLGKNQSTRQGLVATSKSLEIIREKRLEENRTHIRKNS